MAYEAFVGFGTRKGIVYELDENHLPKATSTSPYTGVEIYGIRGMTLTPTNVRKIAHNDGDKVGLVQILPSLDVPSGTITIDGADLNLQSILGSVKKRTVSGMEMMPTMTDQQGNEPEVGLLVYQAAKKKTGTLGFNVKFVPSTQMVPQDGSFGDNNYETTYQLAPSASPNHLFGLPFTSDADGALTAGCVNAFAPHVPRITAFRSDGAEDTFAFSPDFLPSDANYSVFVGVDGVVTEITSGITKTTAHIVFDYTYSAGAVIIVPHMVL